MPYMLQVSCIGCTRYFIYLMVLQDYSHIIYYTHNTGLRKQSHGFNEWLQHHVQHAPWGARIDLEKSVEATCTVVQLYTVSTMTGTWYSNKYGVQCTCTCALLMRASAVSSSAMQVLGALLMHAREERSPHACACCELSRECEC